MSKEKKLCGCTECTVTGFIERVCAVFPEFAQEEQVHYRWMRRWRITALLILLGGIVYEVWFKWTHAYSSPWWTPLIFVPAGIGLWLFTSVVGTRWEMKWELRFVAAGLFHDSDGKLHSKCVQTKGVDDE